MHPYCYILTETFNNLLPSVESCEVFSEFSSLFSENGVLFFRFFFIENAHLLLNAIVQSFPWILQHNLTLL